MKRFCFILTLLLLFAVWIAGFFIDPNKEFAERDLYDEIISRGKVKVGVNVSQKPFGYYNDKGEPVGYNVDLAHYIAQYLLKNPNALEIIPVTPADRLIKASSGDVDIVISTVTITPQRQEVVSFSIPYDIAGQAILVKSSARISSMADLSGVPVGVIFGTTAEKNMQNLAPAAKLIGYKSYDDAFKALQNNDISAITSDDSILKGYAMTNNGVKLLPQRYTQEPYGIAFKKGKSTKKLKQNLDYAIKDMKNKNVLNRLSKKWYI